MQRRTVQEIKVRAKNMVRKWNQVKDQTSKIECCPEIFDVIEETRNVVELDFLYVMVIHMMLCDVNDETTTLGNSDLQKVKKVMKEYGNKNMNVFQLGIIFEKTKTLFHFELSKWYRKQNELENVFHVLTTILDRCEDVKIKDRNTAVTMRDNLISLMGEVTKTTDMSRNVGINDKKNTFVYRLLKLLKNIEKKDRHVYLHWHILVGKCYFMLDNRLMSILCHETQLFTIERTQNLDPKDRRLWRYLTYRLLVQIYISVNDSENAKHCLRNAKGLIDTSDVKAVAFITYICTSR